MGGRRVKKIKTDKPPKRTPKESDKVGQLSGESKPKSGGKKKKRVGARGRKVRGKKYTAAAAQAGGKECSLEEAVRKVKESSYASFDASVDAHINLESGKGKEEPKVRTFITLPHGTGKEIRVLVFAGEKEVKAVSKAGADKIGDESTIEEIAKSGAVVYDAIIAMPSFMPKLAKVARILGPKGLMPSPKTGTVTDDPAKVVKELKKGKVELRTEAQPIIHLSIGKVSFPDKHLIENLKVVVAEINPDIKSITLASTMGPGVWVDVSSL